MNLGFAIVKRCGCYAQWISPGIDHDFLIRELTKAKLLGHEIIRNVDYDSCSEKLIAGAGCQHEQRAYPREDVTAPMVPEDFPPPQRGSE